MIGKLSVTDLPLDGKRVFIRVDYNVPLRDGAVANDRRIRASLDTVRHVLSRRGRAILASHLGRPKGKPLPQYSLRPVASALASLVDAPVRFVEDCVGPEAERAAASLAQGEVLLLENLRFHPEEEKNDEAFSRQLASLAEVYVNDAFGTAHRAHASTVGICRFLPSAAGFLMEREIEMLSRLLEGPDRPYVAVLGGAKVSDKIPLARNLMPRLDALLVGGAMAYTFLKAKGVPVGTSMVETAQIEDASALMRTASSRGLRVLLPEDHVVLPAGSEEPSASRVTSGDAIGEGERGVDIGPKTSAAFRQVISSARTVLWNGPVGWFEKSPFDRGSKEVAEAIAASGAFSVVGGGDSAAAVASFGLESSISHVSTGGGASLEFLSGLTLPGVAALADKR